MNKLSIYPELSFQVCNPNDFVVVGIINNHRAMKTVPQNKTFWNKHFKSPKIKALT